MNSVIIYIVISFLPIHYPMNKCNWNRTTSVPRAISVYLYYKHTFAQNTVRHTISYIWIRILNKNVVKRCLTLDLICVKVGVIMAYEQGRTQRGRGFPILVNDTGKFVSEVTSAMPYDAFRHLTDTTLNTVALKEQFIPGCSNRSRN